MAQTNEGERIVKLMFFIRENGPVSLASIRRALPHEYGNTAGSEASTRRCFERDKKTLQEHGIFLVVDDQMRYSLDAAKSFAAPLALTGPQVSLLRVLCGALLEDKSYPFKEDLRMVLIKLGDELELPDMLPQMLGSSEAGNAGEPQGFTKIRRAIAERKRLSFEYVASTGASSTREVEPFGCFFLHGQCYVVAFDPGAQGVRKFRIDRMRKAHVNTVNPNTPDFEARAFNAAQHYGLPFQFGSDQLVARIRFDENAAESATRLTMGQGALTPTIDGGLDWVVSCNDVRALASWCIECGPGIHIIEPADAREQAVRGMQRFLECLGAHKEVHA